jgi:hypothetical protein
MAVARAAKGLLAVRMRSSPPFVGVVVAVAADGNDVGFPGIVTVGKLPTGGIVRELVCPVVARVLRLAGCDR